MSLRYPGKCFCLLLAVCCCYRGFGQDAVTAPLPDSLTRGAGMVKRMDITEIAIESPRKAHIHRKYVYTILDHSGDPWSGVVTFYDKFHDLGNVSAMLYDAHGNVVKKIKKGDLEDTNIDGMGILMMDARLKYYQFGYHQYPFTVVFEEESTLNGLFGIQPQWMPQPFPQIAVASSTLIIHAPSDYALQYKAYYFPDSAAVADKKGVKTYTWQLSNRPAQIPEPYAAAWFKREPRVNLAPGSFEIEGYKGSCYSWADLGRFVQGLYQGREQLPQVAKEKVHSLVDGLPDDRSKTRVLYEYLQQNTHYVGVELGIGGWQPYDATYVYTRKYGDCKALANYMVALLKEAGIRASPVLIRSGAEPRPIDTAFACNQFDHVIAVAFAGKDSVWLECTSQTLPAGYLGSFTADRDALLLDEQGGHIVHTPVYGARENRLARYVKGSIDEQGMLQARLETDYSGLEQEGPQAAIDRFNKKDLLEHRQQALGLANCTISDLKDSSVRSALPLLKETMQLSAEQFAMVTGNRLMLSPGAFMKRLPKLSPSPNRKNDFELKTSVEESDSIVLQLPTGYTLDGELPHASLSSPFGSYRVRSSLNNGLFTLSCSFREQKGIYPAAEYERLVRLCNLVYRESERQLVFVHASATATP